MSSDLDDFNYLLKYSASVLLGIFQCNDSQWLIYDE